MEEINVVKYLSYSQIDCNKWNKVIDNANNGLMYAHSCYLDLVTDKWGAFIYGDYEYIMPLPQRKKMGILILEQPTYCQQLGIFPTPPDEIINLFIKAIKKHFKYVSVNFNSNNAILNVINKDVTPFNNYLINLNRNYDELYSNYNSHTVRHLKKASKNNLRITGSLKPSTYIDFKMNVQDPEIYGKSINRLENLLHELLVTDRGIIYGVYNINDELCAAGVFIRECKRIIYLNGVSNLKGKKLGAMYLLMDYVINKNAGRDLHLDFEGSKIPGVARFFEGFGAKPEIYFNYKYNKLPIPLRWLKK